MALELRPGRACLASPGMMPPPYGIFAQRLGKLKRSEATHYAVLIIRAATLKTGDSRCLNVISMPSGISLKANNSLLSSCRASIQVAGPCLVSECTMDCQATDCRPSFNSQVNEDVGASTTHGPEIAVRFTARFFHKYTLLMKDCLPSSWLAQP